MRIFILHMLFNIFTAQSSPSISVTCDESLDVPPGWKNISQASPSPLHSLRVDVLTEDFEEFQLNISWAINIDSSIYNLTGTWIDLSLERYLCRYEPPFTEVKLRGLEQLWFHYLVPVIPGHVITITAYNLPSPAAGKFMQHQTCTVPYAATSASLPKMMPSSVPIQMTEQNTDVGAISASIQKSILGCLAGLVVLVICSLTLYKVYRIHTNHPFTSLTKAPKVPVSVLMVYPAENLVFQRAVLAFAEFLQCHGGCQVAIDLWQLSRLAEQGLMRWLAEQVQSADRVLIISPQPEHYHRGPWEHAAPAASHDLFPLVLHMVSSHARSPSELAKFWVVHLGKAPKSGLPVELQSCRDFNLMPDLEKIIRHLHQEHASKRLKLKMRSRLAFGELVTEKLRDAVKQLESSQGVQGASSLGHYTENPTMLVKS